MKRTIRSRLQLALAAGLIPLVAACSTSDALGPGDGGTEPPPPPPPPPTPQVAVTAAINSVRAIHDCDTAADNPGDFHAWVEIWQDINPSASVAEFQQVAKSPEHTITIDSEVSTSYASISSGAARLSRTLERDPARPIQLRAYMEERDPSVDTQASTIRVFRFDPIADCWARVIGSSTACLGAGGDTRYTSSLSGGAFSREDVFDIFNLSDDEGCRFDFVGEAVFNEA